MKSQIKKLGIAALAITVLSAVTGISQAQEADTNLTTIAYWKMDQWATNIPLNADFSHGIADSATNAGQGTLTGAATAPASEEDLYVWGPMENNFQIVGDRPPASMFNRGFNGGSGSWNSANNLNDGGQMLYAQDQFGNEFAGPSFTEEIVFKSSATTATKQTLIWNHQSSAYAHVQLNEDGDTGDITFWGWDGANIQAVRLTNGISRFDDGYWHCAVARYDATTKVMSIYVINQDGSSVSNSITLTQDLNPAGANNLYIGRSEGEGDRFNGLINQVRMSSAALPDSALLAVPGGLKNPHIISYWKFDSGNVNGTSIMDLATNSGQGVLTGVAAVPAAEDDLLIEGPLTSGLDFSSSVPPGSMFNTAYPYTNGTASWNVGQVVNLGAGDVVFPADQYGNELPTPSYTEEIFFKANTTSGDKQTLFFNHRTSAYCILQINEDGDTGSLLFWAYNGGFPSIRITASDNGGQRFDDGNWHYAACRFDAGTTNMSLYVYNSDGTYLIKSVALTAPLVDNNNPNPTFIGNDEGLSSPFNGLINQVRMSDAALPDEELLAVPPPACIPAVVFTSPSPVTSYLNGVASFTVNAGGTTPLYQWRLNGTNLVGKTNAALTIFPVQTTNGGNYDVVVSTPCSSVTATSAPALLTVIPTTAPVVATARWRMEAQANVTDAGGNTAAFQGILDANLAPGQGIYSNGIVVPASEDDLITFNGAGGGLVISNDVPPTTMFINGNDGGTGSLDASWIAAVDGGLFYPQDQYGNEFSSQTSFSVELFFKTAGDQSAAGNMELIKQGEVFFRYGLIVNEAGPGSVRFAVNNGNTIQLVDVTNANYADGKWHYLLAQYDSLGNSITLTLVNTNGTSATATTMLPVGFSPLPAGNDGNMFIGRDTYSLGQDPRTFLGLIDEIQISSGLITPGTGQLGFVPAVVTPHITSIAVSGGIVTIKFTGSASDPASAFTLVGSSTVNGTYLSLAATITSLGGGNFQATIPTGGDTEFYRVKR